MGLQLDQSPRFAIRSQVNLQIGSRQQALCVLGPFGNLEAGAGKDVAKARVFPFTGITEAIKIKMPHVQPRQFIGFYHRVSWALDPPSYS